MLLFVLAINYSEECTNEEYKCKSGTCIPTLTVCDSVKDCPDGDDEEECECARNEVSFPPVVLNHPLNSAPSTQTQTHNNFFIWHYQFKCIRGGQCLPLELKCDGKHDCSDESDEFSCGK